MSSAQDQDFLMQALPAFISEAKEQLESMEQLLLQLETQAEDKELLDALFRCAHTVKGSAGIFGLDEVVNFTHHVETLLDKMRDGELRMNTERSTLLLRCNDHIARLVRAIGQAPLGDDERQLEADLITELQASLGGSATPHANPTVSAAESDASSDSLWHIAAAFGPDTLRNGFDPLSVLRYLGTLGHINTVVCETDTIPPLDTLDPENCHLTLVVALQSDGPREAIESAFSFVREDCNLTLHAPRETVQHWIQVIESMPEHPQLGQLLLAAGAISAAQLEAGLQAQKAAQQAGEPTPRLGEILQEHAGVSPEIVQAAVKKQQRVKEGGAPAEEGHFIRVQASRLDAVINLLGELVIAGAGTEMLARQNGHGALIEASQQLGSLIEEIRNGTLQLRMVPIAETFNRFRRVVRDTCSSLGKEVAFDFTGGETELDKSIVEKISAPLMHLVRNALDHGLETPAARLAAGKPAQGRLTLAARHESGNILIEIQDDGRGIVRRKVLERAWERGLVEHGHVPDDADILRLIFEPGFSTAEQVTDLSGRGVGMDVVRRNIESLRGAIAIHSTEGVGTRIEIRLPLTLAIIDGFLVGVGASRFVFPLECVDEVIECRTHVTAPDERGRGTMELRGEVLPTLALRELYDIEGAVGTRPSVVVLKAGDRRYGVVVDQLLGQYQTVIKPLGRMFRSLRGIAGSTILGNGEVALIFDVLSLAQMVASPPPPTPAPAPLPTP